MDAESDAAHEHTSEYAWVTARARGGGAASGSQLSLGVRVRVSAQAAHQPDLFLLPGLIPLPRPEHLIVRLVSHSIARALVKLRPAPVLDGLEEVSIVGCGEVDQP
jgi:hypothetical protein